MPNAGDVNVNMKRTGQITIGAALAALLITPFAAQLHAHVEEPVPPADIRRLAREAGLQSLRNVDVPRPDNLKDFLRSGSNAKRAAIALGKALYWDMQVGSDGTACASCHFHAGADSRTKNQVSPGLLHEDEALQSIFDPTASGGGGPNHQLTAHDFPFHQFDSPTDRTSQVIFSTDDVCSSQGVFNADFLGTIPGESDDLGSPFADPVFNVQGVNVRRVEPRNTPTVINAVFNFTNFWDGSAHNVFNGVSVAGPFDGNATILVEKNGTLEQSVVRLNNSSLASQAMAPPLSILEMSYAGRPFREIGRKVLSLRPLGAQLVHPKDSVLGKYSRADVDDGDVTGEPGLDVSYADLIEKAFEKKYWESDEEVHGYTQMENNFSLFFGLAIQMYESTLVSDRTPFDAFMEGDDEALDHDQRDGLLDFINRGPGLSDDPMFLESAQGNCISCHSGPEFTAAAYSTLDGAGNGTPTLIDYQDTAGLAGDLITSPETAFVDVGFSNIGVRPTAEDLGRGGSAFGVPLSFVRQSLLGLPSAPPMPGCGAVQDGGATPTAGTEGATTLEVRVTASADDAEEDASLGMHVTSGDLELVQEKTTQTVGIRFDDVDIPPGASIARAYVQFTADEEHDDPTALVIEGQADDDAPAFSAADGNISSRERTTAAVPWSSVPPWGTRKEAGAKQRTPDLSAIVQEIVDRGGWEEGNGLVFIITGSGRRTAESYDGKKKRAPLLHVEYTLGDDAPVGAAGDGPAPVSTECPEDDRDVMDGAFKIPGLRNVELTGPYFHNGGQATLAQVVTYYQRLGDFTDDNLSDLDVELARVFIAEPDLDALILFMMALTDERVRDESKPFDHPQLFVPNGHHGGHHALHCVDGIQACDNLMEIPAVGKKGRGEQGLPPLGTFLDLPPGQHAHNHDPAAGHGHAGP
jgi:cytochrome c peroxidase